MDPLSHGLLGAATAQVAVSSHRRAAACAGFVSALLPDLDVLLQRSGDPLFQLEFHRQFSHSLFFAPLGALITAVLMWRLARPWLSFQELSLACLSGFLTAGLLDACTSYGTQLLWPLSSFRFAWNLTPVVEPVITLGLLILVALSWRREDERWAWAALAWLGLLLCNGAYRQGQALQAAQSLWESRGHREIERFVVKPTLANQILWRVTYIQGEEVFTDGVSTSLFSSPKLYEGELAKRVSVEAEFGAARKSRLYRDMARFERLSEGFLVRHPQGGHVIGDARYSMLPTTLSPLWGLSYEPDSPEEPVRFLTFRKADAATRRRFWDML